jgi:tRNA dimethylallyltransferase
MPAGDLSPLFIAGPTAVGKSALALALAERLNGEIISVDSMQVYRGMDIGTAKPSAAERARVPHHLIDVVDLTESFDAARFLSLARVAVNEIQSRGRVPVFCGGTGLYFKAYRDGLGETPPADAGLRAELEATPMDALLDFLRERDALTFERIDRQNPRRVIRAVEVIRLTGRPFSGQRAPWGGSGGDAPRNGSGLWLGLRRPTEDLRLRIDLRVNAMFVAGLVDETRGLLGRGLAENRTALQALGYRQVVEHLESQRGLDETVEWVKVRTRQFAKRQMTWFRRQLGLHWIDLANDSDPEALADRLIRDFISGRIRNE